MARHSESHIVSPSSEPGPSGVLPVVELCDPSDVQVDPPQEQMGGAEEVPYRIELSGVRPFARSAATESTYRVRFKEQWQGRRLRDIQQQLRRLFEDLLARARENVNQNDLLRVVLRHDGLNHAVVVPLQAAGGSESGEDLIEGRERFTERRESCHRRLVSRLAITYFHTLIIYLTKVEYKI